MPTDHPSDAAAREAVADRLDHPRPVRRLCAVLPAAGRSRRMGRAKLLLPFGDGTILEAVVSALSQGGVGEIALVVPPAGHGTPSEADPGGRQDPAAQLAAWGRERGLVVAENPDPERGMLSTIRCGVEALGGAAALRRQGSALLVTPADLPALGSAAVGAVASALRDGAQLAVPVHAGQRGHPLGIAPSLLEELATLDLEVGLRQLLDRHPDAVVEVPVDDPGALRDVDTPEDYRDLAGRDVPDDPA